jgi:hypothetical protein
MLAAVESTARDAIRTIALIRNALRDAKHRIRGRFRFCSQDLINILFNPPLQQSRTAPRLFKR